MNRAYATFDVKAADDDRREIIGIASSITPDRLGDIVDPRGAEFKLPLPLLAHHDITKPIGHVQRASVGAEQIEVFASMPIIKEAGLLRDRLDAAWGELKAGLVRGLSIGFRAMDSEPIDGSWGVKYLSWEWLELSTVTVPQNSEASISVIKSADTDARAALGQLQSVVRLDNSSGRDRPESVIYLGGDT